MTTPQKPDTTQPDAVDRRAALKAKARIAYVVPAVILAKLMTAKSAVALS